MTQRYIGGLIYNPPGGYSGYFDGSGDYISVPDSADFTMGSGDFTIQCWVFSTANSASDQYILGQVTSGGTASATSFQLYKKATSNVAEAYVYIGGAKLATSSATIPVGSWTHLAMVRDGGTMRLYVNGVQDGTNATLSTSSIVDSSGSFAVGRTGDYDGLYFSGYVSNVSVIKGTCLYPNGTAFTPPSGALPTGTSGQAVLLCRVSTFIDSNTATTAKTVTVGGNSTVSTQNPFPLTTLPNPAQGNAGNGIFSMSQYQSLKQQNLWPASDPYFDYTTLLLHGNGTNGAQNNTFLDSGTANSGSGFSITRNGNTTQGTFTPYGSNWSNYFDASAATPLNFPDNDGFTFNADFTVECWFFATTLSEQKILVGKWDNLQQEWLLAINTSNTAEFHWAPYSAGGPAISSANAFSLNTWNHMAAVRSGSTITLYVNGVSVGTRTDGTAGTNRTSILTIGYLQYLGGNKFGGYISNVRVVKGTAVYTANFTPSTSPLTAITNTQLLTCQSNRFIDNSSNNFTATVNGVSVQRFSPFAPTAPYSTSVIGGSGYFDGSGDYLTTSYSTSAFDWWTTGTDYTIEAWVYPLNLTSLDAGTGTTLCGNMDQSGTDYWSFGPRNNGVVRFKYFNGSGVTVDSTATIRANQWNHIAMTKTSSGITLFVNGVGNTATAISGTPQSSSGTPFTIGSNFGTAINAYISGLRIVKGSAVYSGTTYTVPTAPLTAITNTSLLTNFTNGGIIDNTMMNDLETVGNAQISTSVSKFGGGSMSFDGSGDCLQSAASESLRLGSGDFTIECWVYLSVLDGNTTVMRLASGDATDGILFCHATNAVYATSNGSSWDVINGNAFTGLTTNIWTHLALTRSGSTFRGFVNGTVVFTVTSSASIYQSSPVARIGAANSGGSIAMNGYIDDLRITKGIARYTSNFTPQTSQWQDQ